jgi:enolase
MEPSLTSTPFYSHVLFSSGIPLYRHFADLFGNSTLTLPLPSFNVINGGQHAGNHLAFQVRITHMSIHAFFIQSI